MHLPKSPFNLTRYVSLSMFVVTILTFVTACEKPTPEQAKSPPAAVSVYKVNTQPIGAYREFVARTVASKEVSLKARVEGELIARHFDEGAMVKKGQLLLEIDPASYQASLDSAKADLASRIAGAASAAKDLKRGREVAGDGYISQADLDKLITNESQAKAAVDVADAALKKAKLNLDYTKITAPFSGRIGKVNYSVGNVVGPTSNALAMLTAMDPMYVSFQVEESEFVSYLQRHKNIQNPEDVPIDVSLRLPNNSDYSQKGKLTYTDTKIESGMGTVEMRAEFSNPDGIILPGLFVTLVIEGQDKQNLALVPQAAVQESQQGKFVLVVDDNNLVSQRLVKLGRRMNAMWVVESGLNENEYVIIEGLQKVRAGVEVKPVEKSVNQSTGVVTDLNGQ